LGITHGHFRKSPAADRTTTIQSCGRSPLVIPIGSHLGVRIHGAFRRKVDRFPNIVAAGFVK
jgi:hypothetical protein